MKSVFTTLSLLLFATSFSAAQLSLADSAAIHQAALKLHQEGKLHGGILIAEGESIIYQGAFGMADRDLEITNTAKARFFSASVGKMFTAVLILQLWEEGKLQLDDPLPKHLPWFEHEEAENISIHHLLAHRSGLAEIFSEEVNTEPYENIQQELLKKIAGLELQFEPGSAFSYSNTGYVLLGEIIMKYLGDDYNATLQDRIFEPLGMKSTYWSRAVYAPGSPINYLQSGEPAIPMEQLDFTGPGGEKTTLQDLHRFMLAVGDEKLLRKETWELMFQPHSLPSEAMAQWGPHQNSYGYGFSLIDLPYSGHQTSLTISHGGASAGTSSCALRFKDSERIVVLWNNEFKNPVPIELYLTLAELSKN